MLSAEEQNEIMRQDRKRRYQREQAEAIELWMRQNAPIESEPNLRGIGIVGKAPVSKASQDCWTTGRNNRTRTVGVAPGASAIDGASMKVTYADGSSTIKSLTSKGRPSRSTTPQHNDVPVAREATHKLTAADLAPIGDTNH